MSGKIFPPNFSILVYYVYGAILLAILYPPPLTHKTWVYEAAVISTELFYCLYLSANSWYMRKLFLWYLTGLIFCKTGAAIFT